MQDSQRLLNGALGKASLLGNLAVAQMDCLPPLADCPAPQKQVYDKRCGTVVMTHQISQQHISNVRVEAKVSHGSL